MNRKFTVHNIDFEIGNYTPRKNDFEKGLKYHLFRFGIPTGYKFSTIKECTQFVTENWVIWDY